MAPQVPFREQVEFPAEQGPVIGGQPPGDLDALHHDQRRDGIGMEGVDAIGVALLQHVEVGGAAEVVQQQEALFEVLRQHPRRVDARLGEQTGDMDERAAVFVGRRRVHQDAAATVARIGQPEVAPEARIRRGGCQGDRSSRAHHRTRPATGSEPSRVGRGLRHCRCWLCFRIVHTLIIAQTGTALAAAPERYIACTPDLCEGRSTLTLYLP